MPEFAAVFSNFSKLWKGPEMAIESIVLRIRKRLSKANDEALPDGQYPFAGRILIVSRSRKFN